MMRRKAKMSMRRMMKSKKLRTKRRHP